MQDSTVTSKGQTTLPKDVRAALHLHPGDRVRYHILDGGEVRLVRLRAIGELRGTLQGKTPLQVTVEEMNAAIADGASGK